MIEKATGERPGHSTSALKAPRLRSMDAKRSLNAVLRRAFGSWDLEVMTGRLRWSPKAGIFAGLPEGEPANLAAWLRLVHPDDREAFERAYQRSLDPAGDGAMRVEARVVSQEGLARWFSW